MKIFAAGIATETNMFSPVPTGLEDFRVQRGSEVIVDPSLDLTRLWGPQAQARGDTFVFSLNAWAEPSGLTVGPAYESLRDEILTTLRAAMPVDVVLLMLHGAMVAAGYEDCEEDLLRRVRSIVGRDVVIGAVLDLHCHLSPAKLAAADILVTYKEYPHTDINDRARELFNLAVDARLGKTRPTMALFDCRMVGMYPTSRQPMRGFVDSLTDIERRPGVLSVSFGHGFQFADLPHVGAKMLVVTDDDQALAQQLARELGVRVHALRKEIGFESISLEIETALSKALAAERFPVVLADQSDNIGAGAPGDATFVLRWLIERGVRDVAMAIFYDPEVVRIARRAGRGATLSLRLGGKMGVSSGAPIDMEARVLACVDNYMHARPQQGGAALFRPAGNVVALRCEGIDLIVSSERCQCFCPSIFVDLGIDPKQKRLLIPKSYQHFQHGFAAIAKEIIYMTAPGAVPPDPRRIPYRRLDTTTLYPWLDDSLAAEIREGK